MIVDAIILWWRLTLSRSLPKCDALTWPSSAFFNIVQCSVWQHPVYDTGFVIVHRKMLSCHFLTGRSVDKLLIYIGQLPNKVLVTHGIVHIETIMQHRTVMALHGCHGHGNTRLLWQWKCWDRLVKFRLGHLSYWWRLQNVRLHCLLYYCVFLTYNNEYIGYIWKIVILSIMAT